MDTMRALLEALCGQVVRIQSKNFIVDCMLERTLGHFHLPSKYCPGCFNGIAVQVNFTEKDVTSVSTVVGSNDKLIWTIRLWH